MNQRITRTLGELASLVGGEVFGDGKIKINGVTNADNPKPGHIVYINDPKIAQRLDSSAVASVVVPPNTPPLSKPVIVTANPKLAWAKILAVYHPLRNFEPGISKLASVDSTAELGKNIRIEEYVHIGKNVKIGDSVTIRANTYIDDNVTVGNKSTIHPNVTIYDQTVIGNNVIIHAGCVIGTDGFGYIFNGKEQFKINQIGNVVIEDNVEIGGNVCVDRATIGSTIIRAGSKIDNLVQIAHNVSFGPHSIASAQTGISGSSKVGAHTTLGGQVGVGDHAEIGNQVMLGAQSGIPTRKKVPDKSIFIGSPARPIQEMKKQVAAQLRTYEMLETIRNLKKRVEELERTAWSETCGRKGETASGRENEGERKIGSMK